MCENCEERNARQAMKMIHQIQELAEGILPADVIENTGGYDPSMTEEQRREFRLEIMGINVGMALAYLRNSTPSMELGSLAGQALQAELEQMVAQAMYEEQVRRIAPNN